MDAEDKKEFMETVQEQLDFQVVMMEVVAKNPDFMKAQAAHFAETVQIYESMGFSRIEAIQILCASIAKVAGK